MTIYEILNYFSSDFAVSAPEYFSADTIISWVVSIGSLTLLLLYVLIGWRRRDSLAWMLIYLGICLCSHLVSVWQSHLYAQTDGSLRQLVDTMTRPNILTSGLPNLIYTSFFAIVLSPDKWYRQK